jgi:hypothetical protein
MSHIVKGNERFHGYDAAALIGLLALAAVLAGDRETGRSVEIMTPQPSARATITQAEMLQDMLSHD